MNENLGCAACGLDLTCTTPRMHPGEDMPDGMCDVMIIGEAPGANEDADGEPFIGKSGQLLRDALESVGLDAYGIVFTNVLHCRPPENKTPTKRQIGYCLPILQAEIEHYDPILILLLGGTPLNAVLGESGITNWRGTLIERNGISYLPMFHPAYVLRNTTVLEEWVGDFEKALAVLEDDLQPRNVSDDYVITHVTSVEQAQTMKKAIKVAGICAWDTEDNGLRFGDELVMMSFAVNSPRKQAWTVVIPKPGDCETTFICKDLLANPDIQKVGHNIKFDALAVKGNWGIDVEGIVGDSMLASYILDPVPGRHGLKPLAGRHLGMYDYENKMSAYLALHKEADPKHGGDLRLMPEDILRNYAALDAIATLELEQFLLRQMEDEQSILYTELMIPASRTFTHVETNGVVLDDHIVERYTKIYAAVQNDKLEQLLEDDAVKKYIRFRQMLDGKGKFEFNPNSSHQMRDVLCGCIICPKCHKTVANEKARRGRVYHCKKCGVEFKSTANMAFDGYGLTIEAKTQTGKPSTGWDAIKDFVDEVPMLQVYRYYKLLGKMLSTYLNPAIGWKDEDGRVRSDYRLYGTDTGRAASRNPNLQNIPTPEKEPGTLLAHLPIKNIFTHTWEDGCLLCVDYSGMELRTMASVSNCQGMIDIFRRGEDLHSIVTEFLYDIKRSDYTAEEWRPIRYRAKWTNWTLLFGGSEYTLHRLYRLDKDEAHRLVTRYYELFPEVLEYKEDTLDFARANGYVRSMFGRRKYLPYINDWNDSRKKADERAGINMPIQSSAFDVLMCAMIIIDEEMRLRGMKSMIVNTVHDSIMLDIYSGELDAAAHLCKDVMENVTSRYGPKRFPRLDFSWFTVPLVADMEVGSHYGCLDKYEVER